MILEKTCPACKTENPPEARFCISCGASILRKQPMDARVPKDPLIGKLVGDRFKVLKLIGEGGMGRVYRAEQTSIQRHVALKVLSPGFRQQTNLQNRFRNEASLASRLNHPNTVIIYDFGVTQTGDLFIAMELIDGRSLDEELIAKHSIPWQRTIHIAEQICSSLQAAHAQNIIHRDLKPENIMLTVSGTDTDYVKVLDFGIAKILSGDQAGIRDGLTAPNEVFGTPDYMSPEQVRGDVLDNRTDIYSLGIIMYQMLTGKLPFAASSPIEILARHLTQPPRRLGKMNPQIQVPAPLESLVMAILSKDPNERPESMQHIAERLVSLTDPAPVDVEGDAAPAPSRAPSKEAPPTFHRPPDREIPETASVTTSLPAPAQARAAAQKKARAKDTSHPSDEADALTSEVIQEEPPSTLDLLVERMKKKKDFPAISQHLSELNTKVALESTSAPKLANVILKDTALTTKLIRLVNSPYYSQVRGKITMVTRAVVLMGFDAVRDAALSLLLFDHLQSSNPKQAVEMQDAALGSLLSGIIAKSVAQGIDGLNKEEAFMCGIFHNLGRQAAIYYFPEDAEKARVLMNEENLSERAAMYRILGVTLEDLGKKLAKQWDFPEVIRDTMTRLPPEKLPKPNSKAERLRYLAGFANELTEIAALSTPSQRASQLRALHHRFGASLKISEEATEEILANTAAQLEEYLKAVDIRIADSPFFRNILLANQGESTASVEAITRPSITGGHIVADPIIDEAAKISAQAKVLIDGVEEVEATLQHQGDLNSVMLIVLETMFRGLELSKVIFCLNDVRKNAMRARSGFGDNIDRIIPKFSFSLRGSNDVFSSAVNKGRDTVVSDTGAQRIASKIPKWYRNAIDAPMFLLYPITIKRFPAAMFYGDLTRPNVRIDGQLKEQMDRLRNRAADAIAKSRQFGRI